MKFTNSHEWISVEGSMGTIGVTQFAQGELGDIVYVELPEVGKTVTKGAEAAVLESTKAAADVYAPVSGQIVAINERLKQEPELVNTSPQSEGWLFKIQLSIPAEIEALLDENAYSKLIAGT